jgi:hypothetical protein
MATLLNLSAFVEQLHQLPCSLLFKIFGTLSRKWGHLDDKSKHLLDESFDIGVSPTLFVFFFPPPPLTFFLFALFFLVQDLNTVEELLENVLKFLNSILFFNLKSNPNLLYSLLYHHTLLPPLASHPKFGPLITNLIQVNFLPHSTRISSFFSLNDVFFFAVSGTFSGRSQRRKSG